MIVRKTKSSNGVRLTEADDDVEVIDVSPDDVLDAGQAHADAASSDIDMSVQTKGNYDYASAFSKAGSVSQQETIVKRYIREWSKAAGIDAQVKKIQEPLVDEMMSLQASAFDGETNPILLFLETYLRNNELTPDQFKELNNLWSDRVITNEQLHAASAKDHIILNQNLWKKPLTDIEFIVQSYNWLSKINNIKRYVTIADLIDALRKSKFDAAESSVQFGSGLVPDGFFQNFTFADADKLKDDNSTAVMIRNAIVFVVGDPSGDIKSAADIEKGLMALERIGKDSAKKDTLNDQTVDVKVSNDDISKMMSSGELSRDDFLKIYKYAKMRGWAD